MRNLILTVVAILPTLAAAQETEPVAGPAPAPVAVQPPPAAVPALPDWNLGAGLGINLGGVGFSSPMLVGSAGGLAGLAGAGGLGSLVSLGSAPQPRMTMLIERRLSERLWLGFQGTVSYGAHQSAPASYSYRNLNAEGSIGLRRIFNPRGIIEVSAFGTAGVGYSSSVVHYVFSSTDSMGVSVQTPQWMRWETFSVGAAAGLTLERELVSGLALRVSSSILGFSYSSSNSGSLANYPVSNTSNGIDVGLRFNPSIELRYAF